MSFTSSNLDSSPQLEHFQKIETIQFTGSDSLLIATIDHIDIGPERQFLVVDKTGQQALIFDAGGAMLKVLDPSMCHPGFNVRPLKATFAAERFIFLLNASPWGYRFKQDGECLGSVDEHFVAPMSRYFDIDASGDLYGVYKKREGDLLLRHMDALGKVLDEIELPSSEYPNAEFRLEGGGLFVDATHIFYAPATAPHVLKLTRDGNITATIAHRNSWFRSIEEDLPSKPTPDFFKAAGSLFKNSTITENIFAFSNQHIMVQYRNGDKGFGYQMFTKDGELVAEEVGIDFLFTHAEGGLAYRVIQPELDEQGELPNPYLEVYRFVEP